MKISEERGSMLNGVLLMALFACAAFYIGEMNWAKTLSFSPLVIGIILGMAYANSLRNQLPETWGPGIAFTGKRLLRLGIILYGFRLSFQDVMAVGLPAIIIDGIIVTGTILFGILLGKLLKMDRSIALLAQTLQDRRGRGYSGDFRHHLHVPLPHTLSRWNPRPVHVPDGYLYGQHHP